MTVILNVPSELDDQLKQLAQAEGMSLEAYLARLIAESVITRSGRAASKLLRAWEEEDLTNDPQEVARREHEWEALKTALNAHRSSQRALFP